MNRIHNLTPVTLYVDTQLYENFWIQAKINGKKTSDLILNAMQEYADKHFKVKNNMKFIDFSRTVLLKSCTTDFLTDDSWKDDLISGESLSLIK